VPESGAPRRSCTMPMAFEIGALSPAE
jgi:hypothetical protein